MHQARMVNSCFHFFIQARDKCVRFRRTDHANWLQCICCAAGFSMSMAQFDSVLECE